MDIVTIKRATKGNTEAFGHIIREVQDHAYRIAYCYLGHSEDAMDCVCRGIEKAFTKINQLKRPEYFKTWFIRIVINECKMELNRKKRLTPYNPEIGDQRPESTPSDIDLRLSIEALSMPEKTIVYLKFYGGYTLDEIAKMLDLPPGTVRSKLYRTLKQLRKELPHG